VAYDFRCTCTSSFFLFVWHDRRWLTSDTSQAFVHFGGLGRFSSCFRAIWTGESYIVTAQFDVNADPETAWQVLTDYEGIARFVSSIRDSTIKAREPGRVLLEQRGVGRAWIVSLPMHVILLSPTNGRRRPVNPFVVAGGGLFQTREQFPSRPATMAWKCIRSFFNITVSR
jgi:hypothetical protein